MSVLSLSSEGASVIASTANDERFPASSVIDGSDRTFWCTSGCFPHELVISFPSNILISAVHVATKFAKQITVLRCDKHLPVSFEEFWTVELSRGDGVQRESTEVAGLPARYVKLRIDKGHDEFAAVYTVQIEGKNA